MAGKIVSMDETLGRVARFSEAEFGKAAFLDSVLPEYERKIRSIIGAGVTEDASPQPAIAAVEGFNLTTIKAEKGRGASLHSHATVEVLMPRTGRWAVYWGDEGENEIVLDTFDVVSVPTGIMRGLRNVSEGEQLLLAVIGGDDAGRVEWPERLIERAAAASARRDARGNIVHAAPD